MKLLSTHFVAPAVLTALSFLAGCSSDSPAPNNSGGAGSSAAGSSAAGKGGSAGSVAGSSGGGAGGASAGAAGLGTAGGGAGGGTSAAGSGGGGDVVPATFATVKEMIGATPCTGGACHGAEGVPLHWTAEDPNLYTLVTTHVTKNCGKLVNTANPAESALVKVLQGDCGVAPNITMRMPYQNCWDGMPQTEYPCVPPEKVAAIQAWIAKGAPQQ